MNCPTVKTIVVRLDWLGKVGDPRELAKDVRTILRNFSKDSAFGRSAVDYYFAELDTLLQTHGVEYIARRSDNQHRRHGVTYLNTGDTYTPTICYNHRTDTLAICSWGDIVERGGNAYQ